MRLLVCGSRTWVGGDALDRLGEEILALAPSLIMHGGAKGADAGAEQWVRDEREEGAKVEALIFRADWHHDGKAAGPIRNARMLKEGRPDRGLAFGPLWKRDGRMNDPEAPAPEWKGARSGGWKATGTGDMVRRMLDAGLPVRWVAAPDAPAVDLVKMPEPGEGSGGT